MEIKKLKSHTPKYHDNTEEDVILIPPSVLDNKLRDFEEGHGGWKHIVNDAAFAASLLIAVLTSTFKDFPTLHISGTTIRGVFLTGFILMFSKLLYEIFRSKGPGRRDLITELTKSKRE